VDFPTPARGFLALSGGRLLATHDRGRSWRLVHEGLRLDALDFVTPRAGFGLSGALLFRTLDGGRQWERFHTFPRARATFGPAGPVVSFVDRRRGWAVPTDGRLYRTRDGGRSWHRLRFSCGEDAVTGVSFVSGSVGFAVCGGQPATIMQRRSYYRTRDGGDSWRLTDSRIFTGHVSGIEYVSRYAGFERASRLGIDRLPDHRTLLFTDDADSVVSMSWPDAEHGFALLLHRGLLRTKDGGRHWQRTR
jgi:hypothetical protein